MNDSQVSLNDARRAMLHIDSVVEGIANGAIFVRQIAPQLATIADYLNQQVALTVSNAENTEAQAVIAAVTAEACPRCSLHESQLTNARNEIERLNGIVRPEAQTGRHLG
jgi:hypothetical protein